MSNRVVSATFRHIIDDVITNVRQDFEDMGIEKEAVSYTHLTLPTICSV